MIVGFENTVELFIYKCIQMLSQLTSFLYGILRSITGYISSMFFESLWKLLNIRAINTRSIVYIGVVH